MLSVATSFAETGWPLVFTVRTRAGLRECSGGNLRGFCLRWFEQHVLNGWAETIEFVRTDINLDLPDLVRRLNLDTSDTIDSLKPLFDGLVVRKIRQLSNRYLAR